MAIKKPVVITTSKKSSGGTDFLFTKDQIRTSGHQAIDSYREKAWEFYKSTNIPTTREEPWRRTDIRGLKHTQFKLIDPDQKFDIGNMKA